MIIIVQVAVDTVVAAPGAWGTLSSAVEAAVAEAETFAAASGVPLLAEGDGALFTGGALRVQVNGLQLLPEKEEQINRTATPSLGLLL